MRPLEASLLVQTVLKLAFKFWHIFHLKKFPAIFRLKKTVSAIIKISKFLKKTQGSLKLWYTFDLKNICFVKIPWQIQNQDSDVQCYFKCMRPSEVSLLVQNILKLASNAEIYFIWKIVLLEKFLPMFRLKKTVSAAI